MQVQFSCLCLFLPFAQRFSRFFALRIFRRPELFLAVVFSSFPTILPKYAREISSSRSGIFSHDPPLHADVGISFRPSAQKEHSQTAVFPNNDISIIAFRNSFEVAKPTNQQKNCPIRSCDGSGSFCFL